MSSRTALSNVQNRTGIPSMVKPSVRSTSAASKVVPDKENATNTTMTSRAKRPTSDAVTRNLKPRPTATTGATASSSSSIRAKRPATAASATVTTAASAAASKRPAWDTKGKLEDMTQRNSQLREKLKSTEESSEQVTTELQHTKQNFEKAKKENTALHSRVDALQSELSKCNTLLDELKTSYEQLEKEHHVTVTDLQAATHENTNLTRQVDMQRMDLAQLQTEIVGLKHHIDTLETLCKQRDAAISGLEGDKAALQADVEALNQRIREDELVRKKLHNTIQELKGNIRVFCRVRPVLTDSESNCIEVALPERNEIKSLEVTGEPVKSVTGCGPDHQRKWNFTLDRVFGSEAGQEEVFGEISQLVQSALDGYNVCIFAYGQTGSGKTYTMEGGETETSRGMIPRAVEQIFTTLNSPEYKEWNYELKASFLEIYNEQIRDLLCPPSVAASKKWELKHERSTNQVYVPDLTMVNVTAAAEVHQLLEKAGQSRAVASTAMNEHSSRSHSVFQLHVAGTNTNSDQTVTAVLSLVDLAGSERLAKSGSTGTQLKETQNINKSLSCLGDVISALGSREKHVPFRNSKLTHLLQNSLGGNSKTLMFVNVSPELNSMNETLCSLRFAAKVNACDIGTARAVMQ